MAGGLGVGPTHHGTQLISVSFSSTPTTFSPNILLVKLGRSRLVLSNSLSRLDPVSLSILRRGVDSVIIPTGEFHVPVVSIFMVQNEFIIKIYFIISL